MKTFVMLLLLTASAHAAPLYLSCRGEARMGTVGEPEPATISITIDGTNVKVEDLAPVKIFSNDEDVWTFGSGGVGVWYGQVNRITGQAQIMISVNKSINSFFDGVCPLKAKSFSNGCAPRRELAMASGYRGVFLIGNKAANRITDVQVVDAGGNTIPLPFAEYVARGAEPNYKTLRPAQLPEVERWSRAGQRVEEDMLFAGNSLAKAQRLFECFIKRRPKSRLTIRQRTRVLQEWPPSS